MLNPEYFNISVDVVVRDHGWFNHDSAIESFCEKIAKEALHQISLANYTEHAIVSIALVDDVVIQDLNARFRKKDTPTNVLSFPSANLSPDNFSLLPAVCELGDVIVARETIAREATEQGKEFINHAGHMVVHGVLHLLGYTHDNDVDAQRMESLELTILQACGIADPY